MPTWNFDYCTIMTGILGQCDWQDKSKNTTWAVTLRLLLWKTQEIKSPLRKLSRSCLRLRYGRNKCSDNYLCERPLYKFAVKQRVVWKVLPVHLLCFYCVVYMFTPEAAGPDGSVCGHGCGLDRLQLCCCAVSWRSDRLCESRWETRLTGFDVILISTN